ncbi:hypothetical protein PPMP20_03420 [Paraburkholderia phymatum]|uniref:hypothetical protein n=1 Tax=Paraburkholderia phymatum TaxID=148447 RepID=UPI0002E7F3C4|nr:hypothetical protein [Paraburkholderia phymatum]
MALLQPRSVSVARPPAHYEPRYIAFQSAREMAARPAADDPLAAPPAPLFVKQ